MIAERSGACWCHVEECCSMPTGHAVDNSLLPNVPSRTRELSPSNFKVVCGPGFLVNKIAKIIATITVLYFIKVICLRPNHNSTFYY